MAQSVVENLLGLWYVRNMTASYRRPLEPVPDYLEQSLPYFAALIAAETLVEWWLHGRRRLDLADALCSISQGMLSQLVVLLLRGVELTAYMVVWRHWRCWDVPWDSTWACLLTLLGVDLGYYWFHRAAHEVSLVWAAHQVHHSSERYNLTTALRQSVVQPYFSWLFYLPLAWLGVAPSMFVTHAQFNTIYQFWIHTELVRSLGPLEHVFNTPSHHRVHHARDPHYLDKNYAGVLIVWDRLFGTFCWERTPPTYGLVHTVRTYNLLPLQLGPFSWLLSDVWQRPGLGDKLRRLFYGPGWSPGTGRLGDAALLPHPDPTQPPYQPALPVWLQTYVVVHFSLTLLLTVLLPPLHAASPAAGLRLAVLVTLTLTCLGWLLEGVAFAVRAEVLRCALGIWLLAPHVTPGLPPLVVAVGRLLLVASILFWVMVMVRKAMTRRAGHADKHSDKKK